MIRSIYFERYMKFLIAFCLLVIGCCVFNAIGQSNKWQSLYHNPIEKTMFEENRKDYTYWDEGQNKDVPYASYKEFRDTSLLFYGYNSPYSQDYNPKTMTKASNYSRDIAYFPKLTTYWQMALLFIVPLAGFLLFFVDQKTGFNQFLFSLDISRKKIFLKKFHYLVLPFFLSVLAGQVLYAFLIHNLIPAPYMNATLSQLLTSVLSNFCLLFAMFSTSAFIGSMVGNVFFGPITWGVYWILMVSLPKAVYALGDNIYLYKKINHRNFQRNLFIDSVGKTGGYWWMGVLFIAIGVLILFWGYKKFLALSLENDNAYLLHKKSRWPIWIIMTIFTFFVLNLSFVNSWFFYLVGTINQNEVISISQPIISDLILLLIIACICLIVVFLPEMTRTTMALPKKLREKLK